MSFDLASLDTKAVADAGAKMIVRHPGTGEPLVDGDKMVYLTLLGEDSEVSIRAWREISNRRLSDQASGRKVKMTREGLESDGLAVLVECTIGWGGFSLDGAELSYSKANARALYERFPWLREQANEFRLDRANFLKASPAT